MDYINHKIFQEKTKKAIEEKWNVKFSEKEIKIGGLQKKFDYVSEDENYIGDSNFYKNLKSPSAKNSTIAEYVWLLEKTNAEKKFLIFGNDIEVPERWLNRFGFITNVEFYFYDMKSLKLLTPNNTGEIEKLKKSNSNILVSLSTWNSKDFDYLNDLNEDFKKWIPTKF